MQEPSPVFLLLRVLKVGIPSILLFSISLLLLNQYYWSPKPGVCGVVEVACGTETPKYSAQIEKGKMLFRNYCATCHNKNMRDRLTGPALAGVEDRWSKYPKADLYQWIRNSEKMIMEGHPKALELWEEWQPTIMVNFTALSDEEIDAILAYIEVMYSN